MTSGVYFTRLETAAAERRALHAGRAERCERLRAAFEHAESAAREAREWATRREQEIAAAQARREELLQVIDENRALLEVLLQADLCTKESFATLFREADGLDGQEGDGLAAEAVAKELGIEPPKVSWGLLASDSTEAISPVRTFWWLVAFPAAAMGGTLLALNVLGDGLRDALDPKLRGEH